MLSCLFDEEKCEAPGVRRGLFRRHYSRVWQRARTRPWELEKYPQLLVVRGVCTWEGCDAAVRQGPARRCPEHRKQRGEESSRFPGWSRSVDRRTKYVRLTRGRQVRLEHRMVVEQMIGRPLERHETIHHKNGIKDQNDPSNLELWSKSQPAGQRVADRLSWALSLLREYGEVEFQLDDRYAEIVGL